MTTSSLWLKLPRLDLFPKLFFVLTNPVNAIRWLPSGMWLPSAAGRRRNSARTNDANSTHRLTAHFDKKRERSILFSVSCVCVLALPSSSGVFSTVYAIYLGDLFFQKDTLERVFSGRPFWWWSRNDDGESYRLPIEIDVIHVRFFQLSRRKRTIILGAPRLFHWQEKKYLSPTAFLYHNKRNIQMQGHNNLKKKFTQNLKKTRFTDRAKRR